MRLARVVGTVVSTVKNPPLEGKKLLLLQPIDARGGGRGGYLLGLDAVGAGVGESVYFVRGKEASFCWDSGAAPVPTDCTIVGILDRSNFPDQ